ncbi:MAG: hypothetical protein IT332_01330 [Ardenticatenales bacterium]|nr:hypothetical protein [Ardenticatenales bacterium]
MTAQPGRAVIGRAGRRMSSWSGTEVTALVAILALALALRLWSLGDIPPGLHVDEAHNGVDALAILRGARPLYLAGNNGREAMLSYLQAVTVGLWGPTPYALRLASALAGTAAVGVAYGLARGLPTARPRLAAAATAVLMAVSVWPLHFSRIGIRGILMPLLGGAFAWALWRAASTGSVSESAGGRPHPWPRFALAGAILGAALYAHPAARLMPLVPVLFLGGQALAAWRRGDVVGARARLVGLATLAAAAAVVAAPLVGYALTHRELFFGHSVSVSVLEADNRTGGLGRRLTLSALRTFRAFVWDGSDSWYHNVKGRPVFDGVTAAMAVVGVGVLASGVRASRDSTRPDGGSLAGFVAVWLIVLALPAVLTGGAPNFSRSVGLMPIAFVVPALGYCAAAGMLAATLTKASRRRSDAPIDIVRGGGVGRSPALLLAVLLIPAAASTLIDYFGRYAHASEAAEAFGAATRAKADALRALAGAGTGRVFPSRVVLERSVYRFLLDGVDLTPIDATGGLVVPADGHAWLVFDADVEGEALQAVLERWPRLRPAESRAASGWRTLRIDAVPEENGNVVAGDTAFDGLTLLAVAGGLSCDALPPEDDLLCSNDAASIDLALRWRVDAVPGRDWTAFAHLVAADARTVAQHDGVPLSGSLPTSRWRAGDTVIDRFVLRFPDDVAPGRYRLHIGWYDAGTGERLGLPGDADGAADVAAVHVR